MNTTNKILILSILFNYNNIFFTVSDLHGKIKLWNSTGFSRVKGSKKITTNSIKLNLKFLNLKFSEFQIYIKLKGINRYKKILLKLLKEINIQTVAIHDTTNQPFNGCKSKKNRRI
nr:ribosomal protein S11 [Pleonosporium sp.]